MAIWFPAPPAAVGQALIEQFVDVTT